MVKGLNRRGFLKIVSAAPLIGTFGIQHQDKLGRLREISLRIMNAPTYKIITLWNDGKWYFDWHKL